MGKVLKNKAMQAAKAGSTRSALSVAVIGALMAVLCICSIPALGVPKAYADDYSGRTDWSIIFTSDAKMERQPADMSFTDAVGTMQPGDTNAVVVTLQNKNASATDWYMSNEVLTSLEESVNVASGGAYSYLLTYTDPKGSTSTFYDSENVGGDESGEAGVGLNEATSSLEDYFYLGQLASGERGYVTLEVSLDGETQNNAYQDTLADIQMNFAAEIAADPADRNTTYVSNNPRGGLLQMGDELSVLPWVIAAAVCGIVIFILAILGVRLRRKSDGKEASENV